VFNHKGADYTQCIKDFTNGMDIIIEMLANVNLVKDLDMIKSRGTIVIVGSRGKTTFAPRYLAFSTDAERRVHSWALRLIMSKEAIVTAVALPNSTKEELVKQHSCIMAGLANGTLHPIIKKEYDLLEAPKAHEDVINGNHGGKIVLLP